MPGYRPVAAGVEMLDGTGEAAWAPDLLVFDVDGVLIDTHASYAAAVLAAVDWYARVCLGAGPAGLGPADVAAWKAAGGFNNDWHVAQGLCLYLTWRWRQGSWPGAASGAAAFAARVREVGGGLDAARGLCGDVEGSPWSPDAIARVCMERYAGEADARAMFGIEAQGAGPGLWRQETPLVSPQALAAWRGRAGVLTGRNTGEAELGLGAAGLGEILPATVRWTADSGAPKPDPAGLEHLVRLLAGRRVLFVGDTPDDAETARRFQAAHPASALAFAGVLGGAAGAAADAIFRGRRVEVIAQNTASLLAFLAAGHPR